MTFKFVKNRNYFSQIGQVISCLFVVSSPLAASPETIFKTNCVACHKLENKAGPIVGPSLVEISHIYKNDLKGYLKWCNEPGKKRKGAVQMPSMAHVGDKDLEAVYHWIIKATKGKKYTPLKKSNKDLYALSGDAAKQPRIQRIFLPDTSPASIAVTIDGQHSLCWDTVSCRLRYVWAGGFIDGYPYWRSNGSSVAKVTGKVYYRSGMKQKSGFNTSYKEAPLYKGYRVVDGLPTFSYKIGSIEVSETVQNKAGALSLLIKLSNVKGEVRYPLGDLSNTDFSHSSGRLEDGALVLTEKEAASFELTFKPKLKVK